MAYNVIIKPLVFYDVEDALKWYNKLVDGLGNRFYLEFWDAIDSIKMQPFTFSYFKDPIRRSKMKTFPYKIYYIIDNDTVFILGLAHSKREDAYIKRRLR